MSIADCELARCVCLGWEITLTQTSVRCDYICQRKDSMDNQHRKISGYRELTEADIELMNRVKGIGDDVGHLVEQLEKQPGLDPRWIAIGKTQLQQGFMALVRGIAQPTKFS